VGVIVENFKGIPEKIPKSCFVGKLPINFDPEEVPNFA